MFDDFGAWSKALHIMAFAAWMAALWYLPRLMVYHADAVVGSEVSEQFKIMERRLLKAIATPAMITTLIFGISTASVGSYWSSPWLHAKLLCIVGLMAVHMVLAKHVRLLAADERPKSATYYRVLNEIPTLLFIVVVILAVFRPF